MNDLKFNCTSCGVALNTDNATKNGKIKGIQRYEHVCKPCDRKKENEGKNRYSLHCQQCGIGSCRKYGNKKPFCSDKCRLMFYVNKTDDCWLWTGAVNKYGYGKLSSKDVRYETAHRLAYKLFKGGIGAGLYVCHSCDVPLCVNPGHLWVGNVIDNVADSIKKDRHTSKLSASDIVEIRRLREELKWPVRKISDKFSISVRNIYSILNGRIWKHV